MVICFFSTWSFTQLFIILYFVFYIVLEVQTWKSEKGREDTRFSVAEREGTNRD